MAYSIIGNPLVGVSGPAAGRTVLLVGKPALSRGLWRFISCLSQIATTLKVKHFRSDGTNYVFIQEKTINVVVGTNTNITLGFYGVEKGDFLGFSDSGTIYYDSGGVAGDYYQLGDISTTTTIASWSAFGAGVALAIQGQIFARTTHFEM